jgi:hypothetical protein
MAETNPASASGVQRRSLGVITRAILSGTVPTTASKGIDAPPRAAANRPTDLSFD